MRAVLLERIRSFRKDERGTDLIELALVIAFVVLGSTALSISAGADVRNLLSVTPQPPQVDPTAF